MILKMLSYLIRQGTFVSYPSFHERLLKDDGKKKKKIRLVVAFQQVNRASPIPTGIIIAGYNKKNKIK